MVRPDLESLGSFLLTANQAGYGNPDAVIGSGPNKSHTISYQASDWRFYDLFYGGQPYAGQEVVYFKNKPVWAMQYRGWLEDESCQSGQIYGYLKQALLKSPAAHPWRGPKQFKAKDFVYLNHWQGALANFQGQEEIKIKDQTVYAGLYFGGLVDVG